MYEQVEKPKENKNRAVANYVVQKKENNIGLPDNRKSGIENLAGFPMADVSRQYNSHKPAQLQTNAYTQGTNIYLASGQEKHISHEAWHVLQQKQRRMKSTTQLKGNVDINDDEGLEREADVMWNKSFSFQRINKAESIEGGNSRSVLQNIIQKKASKNDIDKTEISHTAGIVVGVDKMNHKVGIGMTAKLAPNHPLVGSATGPNWKWMQALRNKYFGAKVVRGHLLNHDLGGVAEPHNLYPISTAANNLHSHSVEQKVKGLLNMQVQENDPLPARIFYNVKVDEDQNQNPENATFSCSWGIEGYDEYNDSFLVPSKLKTDGYTPYVPGTVNPDPRWSHHAKKGTRTGTYDEMQEQKPGNINVIDATGGKHITDNVNGNSSAISEDGFSLIFDNIRVEYIYPAVRKSIAREWVEKIYPNISDPIYSNIVDEIAKRAFREVYFENDYEQLDPAVISGQITELAKEDAIAIVKKYYGRYLADKKRRKHLRDLASHEDSQLHRGAKSGIDIKAGAIRRAQQGVRMRDKARDKTMKASRYKYNRR